MSQIEFPGRASSFLAYFVKSLTPWQKLAISMMMLVTALVVISNSIMMYGFKLLVDRMPLAEVGHPWETLATPFAIIAACCLFHTVMYRVRDLFDMFSMPYVLNDMRGMIMKNIMKHAQEFFHNRFSGEMVNKIGNTSMAYRNLLWERILHGVIPAFFSIAASCVLLGAVDMTLPLILMGVVVGLCISCAIFGMTLGKASANLADRESDISGQLVDTLSNISSVNNYANQKHEIRLLEKTQAPYVRAYRRFVGQEIIFWGAFDLLISSLVIGFVYYLIESWANNRYSAGDVAVCTMIAWDMWWRLSGLSWQLTQLSGDLGRIQSALSEFVRPVTVADKEGAGDFMPQSGEIAFHHVSFMHDSGHVVFDDLNLVIPPSQKVGLVGLSGAGKTTLCQLLLRNYDVQKGVIEVGGVNITDVTQESLRHKIAVIPQDPTLFHRSLRENILYGRPEASDFELRAAVDAAQAHDFIMATPHGYETTVGERGVKLSGGQRQRIAIARAILKNAPILILDEATSALDSETEKRIQKALDTAMEGRTTIVVAHRLSTLAHMDRLIVLDKGKIVEDGTLEELIRKGGHFAHLWNLQAGGFLPDSLEVK